MSFTPTTFAFYTTIPATPHYPGDDQPQMLTNNLSIGQFVNVDHISFTTEGAGWHKQVTFPNNFPPGVNVPTNNQSRIFTDAGSASSSPFLQWINSQATFPLSAIRAFGVVNVDAGLVPTIKNSYNVASVSGSGFNLLVNLKPGAIVTTDADELPAMFFLLTSLSSNRVMTPTISGTNQITAGSLVANSIVNFVVLQF